MKILFLAVAVFEGATGLALLVAPGFASTMLLGREFEGGAGSLAARILGSALIAIAIVCAKAVSGERGSTSRGIVSALLFYNVVTGVLLTYAGVQLGMHSALLWPAIVAHAVLAGWSLAFLRRTEVSKEPDNAE